ncbi:eukaryotic translation initiation factor 5-like [Rhopilema esculentum]|uniref:eukaryotic translation initiation factor 5-like n=1 Tax=Rhopilema esculentum TaxID=499914 RepID=UPI0031D4EB13|eukprot:gene3486-1868_t
MAMVNVNRKVTDQFYRYKMPKLIAKVEGKGNGIKTVVVNMVDVAKALNRPPLYPTKYFGCELGANTQFDKKNDRYIVNGSHDADKLQELLDSFIERYVLCPECENPETNLSVKVKSEKISQQCIACGYTGLIDTKHRVAQFILKNPPASETETVTPQKGKKGKNKKEQKTNGELHSPTAEEPDSVDKHLFGEKSMAPPSVVCSDGFGDWSEDVTDEAVKKRMEGLSESVKGLIMNDDLEKTPEERINIFFQFVKSQTANGLEGHDKDILAEAERLDIKDKAVLVLAEIFFTDNMLQEIKKYRKMFLKLLNNNQKAQKYLMGAVEMLIGKSYKTQLMPKVPHVLKCLYDSDYVEEEVFLQWGSKVSKRYVSKDIAEAIHKKAEPFLKWLKEAEEESDEDDEENDAGVDVVYSSKSVPADPEPAAVEEDESYIDDI